MSWWVRVRDGMRGGAIVSLAREAARRGRTECLERDARVCVAAHEAADNVRDARRHAEDDLLLLGHDV